MKKIVITGGASGIGRHMATGFAAKGYEVFALDKQRTTFIEEHIHFFPMDLEEESQIHRCFRYITKQYGEIHVLINNGAVSKFHKPVFELTPQEFDRVIRTNLRGAFLCCKEFISQHSFGSYGRIINIASTRFHQNEAGWEAYGASKGGLVSLTNSLCVSLSCTGITVNAVSPGWIQVEDYEELTEIDHKQHPSGRVGKPEDILNACLFLCEASNDFINGANLLVDGGMTKKMIYADTPDFNA
ncbi:SDR family NAD(P)-dependent oxidoreductase [Mailhella massiliensis]|uniref:SDR family oxidoreductase n=1 Tax=Mailhella massiliensis TaxID=1903261 RepID=A0A921DRC2_9BACT|nr:SDR family oxidoreductase [Mailhella massiliensis]HJD96828.1 SDR family oxidoreductase [Mailhella massiliensis]